MELQNDPCMTLSIIIIIIYLFIGETGLVVTFLGNLLVLKNAATKYVLLFSKLYTQFIFHFKQKITLI